MYRNMGLYHPLHEQIDEAVQLTDMEEDDDEGSFPSMIFDDDDDE